jgi:hypothetical protein
VWFDFAVNLGLAEESKSHSRVSGSFKFFLLKSRNPTHGSEWLVQFLSTKKVEIPLTEVSGSFNFFLLKSRNPTHGSEWLVQFLSTKPAPLNPTESHQRQLVDASDLLCRTVEFKQSERSINCRWWDFQLMTSVSDVENN